MNNHEPCPACSGTGEERSDVCHCGIETEGHSVWENHSATEMTRRCETCGGSGSLDDTAVLNFLDRNSRLITNIEPPESFPDGPIRSWVIFIWREDGSGEILGAGKTLREAVIRWMTADVADKEKFKA